MSLGIPIKLLHEATGFSVTLELTSGDIYKGTLQYVEDNMNWWLHDVIHTSPDGSKEKSDSAYLRGSNVLYIIVPEMFANAKLFQTGEVENQQKRTQKIKRTFTRVKIRKQSQ